MWCGNIDICSRGYGGWLITRIGLVQQLFLQSRYTNRVGFIMKLLTAVLMVLLFVCNFSSANTETTLPSFGETILKEQFPEYKESADVERGLRRYRVQLESFRDEVLEGYNRSVSEYRQQLIDSDGKLELDQKRGRITSEIYTERHDYLRKELTKSQGNGEHMVAYFNYLEKYQAEVKWVNAEIEVEVKKKLKF